jgi:hypothetical protein
MKVMSQPIEKINMRVNYSECRDLVAFFKAVMLDRKVKGLSCFNYDISFKYLPAARSASSEPPSWGRDRRLADRVRANTRRLRNSGVAAHRPMLTWPMGLRSEATHGRDLISRRVTG